jgi:hypothetical protein
MLKEPYEEALAILRKSHATYNDETGRRTKGQAKWLWQVTDKNSDFHYLFKLGLRADTHDFKLGRTGRFYESILRDEEKLWAFIEDPSLDLTNNLSERNLRPAVLWRKVSFGNKSTKGEQYILDYLIACFQSRNKCLPIPSFVCIN